VKRESWGILHPESCIEYLAREAAINFQKFGMTYVKGVYIPRSGVYGLRIFIFRDLEHNLPVEFAGKAYHDQIRKRNRKSDSQNEILTVL
jgi:hypothetical protein